MKKYTNYKIGLLTGLLSFNTFSSCVQTSEKLGWCPDLHRYKRNCLKFIDRNPKKVAGALIATIAMPFVVGWTVYYFGAPGTAVENANGTILPNATALPNVWTPTPWPYGNLTDLETFVNQSIAKGTTEWGIEDVSSEGSPTTVSSTPEADDGVLPVADSRVLDERVMEDLKKNRFSKARIDYWLRKGLDVNAKTGEGYTLLYETAREPNEGSFKELVKQPGIDLNVKGYVNILQWAVANGYSGIVDLTLKGIPGMNVAIKDEAGNNLYHLAAKEGHPKVVAALVPYTTLADLEEKNNAGQTPLQVAEEKGDKEVVTALENAIASKSQINK